MRRYPRFPLTALAVALLAVTAAGCQPGDKADGADKVSDKSADAAPAGDAANALPGLATEKEQASYMIGMALGKQVESIKDDVDVDTIVKAFRSAVAGEDLLLTEEQAQKIGQEFSQKMQAKQMEKMLAEAKENTAAGEKFLAENAKKPEVKTTESGLQYQVITAGEGPKPGADDTVRVNYKGSLLDGTVFDESAKNGGPAEVPLAQVVPGWQEGIKLMPVGSKYTFWIPAALAYGPQGTPGGPIPPNATLVFEVELLDIVKAPTQ